MAVLLDDIVPSYGFLLPEGYNGPLYCTRQPAADSEHVGQELHQKVANTEHAMDHHTVEVGDDLGCPPAGSRRMDELGKKQRISSSIGAHYYSVGHRYSGQGN